MFSIVQSYNSPLFCSENSGNQSDFVFLYEINSIGQRSVKYIRELDKSVTFILIWTKFGHPRRSGPDPKSCTDILRYSLYLVYFLNNVLI